VPRIFILSPANLGGIRAGYLLRDGASFELATRVHDGGARLGEVMSFVSGLYFRGKDAYARAFARPPAGEVGSWVVTPNRRLLPLDSTVDVADLRKLAGGDIDAEDRRYRRPLVAALKKLVAAAGAEAELVLLGSIASAKYVDVMTEVLGERLLFPPAFVGRGDMSRGSLMLRCAESGEELAYAPVVGAVRHGSRPPKLEPWRWK
jgi:hypothetical protein